MTTLNLYAVLAHEPCHCEALKDFFAKPKCEPATSHTCGVVEAISLPVDRHTAFAMTTLKLSLRWNVVTEAISLQATLVFGLLRYARNDKKQDGREAQDLSP